MNQRKKNLHFFLSSHQISMRMSHFYTDLMRYFDFCKYMCLILKQCLVTCLNQNKWKLFLLKCSVAILGVKVKTEVILLTNWAKKTFTGLLLYAGLIMSHRLNNQKKGSSPTFGLKVQWSHVRTVCFPPENKVDSNRWTDE